VKPVRFETVAAAHIRGVILDELRSADWAPRSVRRRHREMDDAIEDLEAALGHEPTPTEIAQYLSVRTKKTVTPEDVVQRRKDSASARVHSLDEPINEYGTGVEVEDRGVVALLGSARLPRLLDRWRAY